MIESGWIERLYKSFGGYALCVLLCAFILVIRDLPEVLSPTAPFEDGLYLISYFHENPQISAVWRFYASYVSLGPNLIGYWTSLLPLDLQPLALMSCSVLIAAASIALLFWKQIEIEGLDPKARLVAVFVLVLAPVGNFALVLLTMYTLWHMLFFLSLVVLFWAPTGRTSMIVIACLGAISIMSHPGSLVLLPFVIWRAFTAASQRTRTVMYIFLVAMLVYLAFGIDWGSEKETNLDAGTLITIMRVFAERVIFETFFGTDVRMYLVYNGLIPVMWVFSIIVLVIIGVLTTRFSGKADARARNVAFLMLISFSLAAFSTVTRGGFLDLAYGHRYSYVSCWLLVIVVIIVASMGMRGLAIPQRFWSPIVVGAILLWGGFAWKLQSPYHGRDLGGEIEQLSQFLQTAELMDATNEPYCLILDRDEWSILLSSGTDQTTCTIVPN